MSAPEVVTLLGEEAAGGKVATSTFSLPKKKRFFPSGGFGRRSPSPSPGKFRWLPFAGQVGPNHSGRRRAQEPLTPGPRSPGPRRAQSRRAAWVWAPVGARARLV